MNALRREFEVFVRCSRSMQILLVSNMIYAFVLPVIEIFIAAYVMRNSQAVSKVVTYELSLYIATPVAFFVNGMLLGRVAVKHLYAAGMLLSGLAMIVLMRTGELTTVGIAISGLAMGLATGLFWANRGFLALATTDDGNRNYYYGIETFSGTLAAVAVPALIGWFIGGTTRFGWLGGVANHAYRIVAFSVFGLTVLSAGILQLGTFRNPLHPRFIFLRFPTIWYRMLALALLKGLAQGYMITAPAMLIMMLVGKEGTLGATQAIGGLVSAGLLYGIGRAAAPRHRLAVLSIGVLLFFAGAAASAVLFNAAGVLIFMGCLVLSKPLLDLGYNPIELRVVDTVSRLENRSEYAYLFNHEFGLFVGRFLGCVLFLAIAYWGSGIAALRYAMPMIALLQLISIPVAAGILRELKVVAPAGSKSEAIGKVASHI
jgi:MFS transporter, YQGE family, putative transporter